MPFELFSLRLALYVQLSARICLTAPLSITRLELQQKPQRRAVKGKLSSRAVRFVFSGVGRDPSAPWIKMSGLRLQKRVEQQLASPLVELRLWKVVEARDNWRQSQQKTYPICRKSRLRLGQMMFSTLAFQEI